MFLKKKNFEELRRQMVQEQILRRGIRNTQLLNAMIKIPRHKFVPYTKPEYAYGDGPLPIGQGQTISQPYVIAYMTEQLGVQWDHRVLEVGTGSGYQAAVLCHMCRQVYSIEILPNHFVRARKALEALKYNNVHLRLGDGRAGWPEKAPYDRIIVTAAASDEVPKNLLDQLVEGGKMIIPFGETLREQRLLIYTRRKNQFNLKEDLPVRFVPLVHGDPDFPGQ